MLGDVVRNVLPGSTRDQLEANLGYATEPLEESGGLRAMDYETGPQRDSIMRIDSEWLRVWIDDSDRFVRYELWSD